jgi:hypothetical protein
MPDLTFWQRGVRHHAWPVAIFTLAALPSVTALVTLVGQRWTPVGDQALEVLRIRDTGGPHTPLIGVYSRWGWAHPGPLLFWQLAPFNAALGDMGVLVGTALSNLVSTLAIVGVALRRGGTALAGVAALVVLLLVRSFGVDLLVDPWNPYISLLPLLLLILLVWSVLCDDVPLLPVAVVVGSYIVQTHVGYLPIALALLTLAYARNLAVAMRDRHAGTDASSTRLWWTAVATLVGIVLWLPPLVQQVTDDPGNLAALASYRSEDSQPRLGWAVAFGQMGDQIRLDGSWISGSNPAFLGTGSTLHALGLLTCLVTSAVLLRRCGRRDAALLSATTVLTVLLGVATAAGVTGDPWFFVLRWWWVLGALTALALAWAVLSSLRARASQLLGRAVVVAAIPIALLTVADGPVQVPDAALSHVMGDLAAQSARQLDPGLRYIVRAAPQERGLFVGGLERGIFVDLERRGFDVRVDAGPLGELMYGTWRLARSADVDEVVLLVPTVQSSERFAPRNGRIIASWDPLLAEERERAAELEERIRAAAPDVVQQGAIVLDRPDVRVALRTAGVAGDDIAELFALQQRGDRYTVYAVPVPPSGR